MNRKHFIQLMKHIKQGSYKLSCDFVKNNQLEPIEGENALKLIITCTHSLSKKYSVKHLVQFMKFFKFDDIQGEDLSNYLKSIYFIVQFLIEMQEWRDIISLKSYFLLDFIKANKLMKEHIKTYASTRQILTMGIIKVDQSRMEKAIFLDLIKIVFKMEQKMNEKELLKFLLNIAAFFENKQYSPELGQISVELLMQTGTDLVGKSNFSNLMAILRKCFVNRSPVSTGSNLHLIGEEKSPMDITIEKLKVYIANTKIQGVFDYFLASITFFKNLEQLSFEDDAPVTSCMQLMHKMYDNVALKHYLEEIVFFCYMKTYEIRQNVRRIAPTTPIDFKNSQKTLEIYISLAKSEAIILKQKDLANKCCCSIKTDLDSAIKGQITAFDFIFTCIKLAKDPIQITDGFYQLLYQLSVKCCEMLELLKAAKCKQVTNTWDYLGMNLLKLVQNLYAQKRHNVNIKFLKLMATNLFVYESENGSYFNDNVSKTILYYYVDCLVSFKRWNDAMDICALSVQMYPEYREPITRVWNTILYNCRSTSTICEVIEGKSSFLLSTCGQKYRELTQHDKRDLYQFEVNNYVKHYKTIAHIEKCLGELAHLMQKYPENYIKFLVTIPFVVLCRLNLAQFINSYSSNLQSNLGRGIYKYFLFKSKYFAAIDAFKAEPKSIPLKKIVQPQDEPDLIHEIPTPASNYEHVRVDNQNTFIVCLKDATDHFKDAEKSSITETVLDLVVSIAHEFELHCFEREARRAWYLAINFARQLKNDIKVIHIVSFLLKYEDSNVEEMIGMCEKRLESGDTFDVYTKCTYYSALATYYLKTDNLIDFRRAYTLASTNFADFGGLYRDSVNDLDFKRDLACGHYASMICALDMLPCKDLQSEMHGDDSWYMPLRVWIILTSYIAQKHYVQYGEFLFLYFTLSEHIVWKQSLCGLFTEAVGYAMRVIAVAENALLTYRVCRMLVYMAKMDIRRLQVDHCEVKIIGLREILHFSEANEEKDEEVDLATRFQANVYIRDTSPYQVKKFRMPAFVKHENCVCTACITSEFQNVLIEIYNLETQIADYYKDFKAATAYFNGICRLLQLLQKNKQFFRVDTHVNLIWSTLEYNRRMKNHGYVDINIKSLLAELERRQYKNYYLYNEIRNLQVAIYLEQMDDASKSPAICKTPEITYESTSPLVTPEGFSFDVLAKKSDPKTNRIELLVPELENKRTRLRVPKNLYADLNNVEDNTTSNAQTKKKVTKAGASKSTTNKKTTRKGMR